VRSKSRVTAHYGFGVASSGGFGATAERPGGIQGCFGLWGRDDEDKSSNYRELRNLANTVEEEATEGHLTNGELWLFTDNSTAESCFFRVGSSLKLLHELVLRLRKAEMTSVNQKNDLLKLISVEKFLLDLVLNKLYLSYATWFLIQFICTRYLLIQFVTNYVIF
jgi:hypothetical protein